MTEEKKESKWLDREPHRFFGGNDLTVSYSTKKGIFIPFNRLGMIPDHEGMLELIEELYIAYESLSEEEIHDNNREILDEESGDNFVPKLPPVLKPVRKPREGYIYLFQAGDTGVYKIGMAINPARRLKEFQTSSHEVLTIKHLVKTSDMIGSERAMHIKFSGKRVHGEWFRLSPEEVTEFCGLKEGDL